MMERLKDVLRNGIPEEWSNCIKLYYNYILQGKRREWIEDNGRQRSAVSNFRHAEFSSRRDGRTRVRYNF